MPIVIMAYIVGEIVDELVEEYLFCFCSTTSYFMHPLYNICYCHSPRLGDLVVIIIDVMYLFTHGFLRMVRQMFTRVFL